MWNKIRKILGILTDLLIKGRELGFWERGRIDTWGEYKDARRLEEQIVEQHINGHKIDMNDADKLAEMMTEYEERLSYEKQTKLH